MRHFAIIVIISYVVGGLFFTNVACVSYNCSKIMFIEILVRVVILLVCLLYLF